MPGPVSDSYPGPSDEMPYVSSWCYRNPIVAAAEVVRAGSRPPSRLKRHAKRFPQETKLWLARAIILVQNGRGDPNQMA